MIAAIKILALFQVGILVLLALSFKTFINFEIAFLSATAIMLGSMYSYSKLVRNRVGSGETPLSQDAIDTIEDPFDLYSDSEPYDENMELKEVIKAEKKRIKSQPIKNAAIGSGALVSLYRLVPYLFLVVGFIGLNNNQLLALLPYLSGLGVGIVGGYLSGVQFIQKS
jgi:hypothetical protein